jgi:hypothetical protein
MLLSATMGWKAWDILKYKMAAKIAAPTWCSAVLSAGHDNHYSRGVPFVTESTPSACVLLLMWTW